MSNIRNVLEVICKAVNENLQNLEQRGDDWVVLSSIVGHGGGINEHVSNKVVMTVYNVTRENMVSNYTAARAGNDAFAMVRPPIYINLYLMFMANFADKNYTDGLAAISRVISFFQQNPCFTQANRPELQPGIDKLTLEMENLTPTDVSFVMGVLGTKYLPSAFYKLRLLPFDANAMYALGHGVQGNSANSLPEA